MIIIPSFVRSFGLFISCQIGVRQRKISTIVTQSRQLSQVCTSVVLKSTSFIIPVPQSITTVLFYSIRLASPTYSVRRSLRVLPVVLLLSRSFYHRNGIERMSSSSHINNNNNYTTTTTSTNVPTIDEVMERIRSLRINFIAIDFDQTLIDIHTGGVYTGSFHDIIPHVRPIFIELITAALQDTSTLTTSNTAAANGDTATSAAAGIHIAIVTYSKQPTLIRSILEHVFGMEMASKIMIRGNDKSWKYEGNGMKDGKQSHMASAVEEILHHHHDTNTNSDIISNSNTTTSSTTETTTKTTTTLEITRRTSLLIDDDQRNIRIALENGTRAIWYNPKGVPQQLYHQLAQLV